MAKVRLYELSDSDRVLIATRKYAIEQAMEGVKAGASEDPVALAMRIEEYLLNGTGLSSLSRNFKVQDKVQD